MTRRPEILPGCQQSAHQNCQVAKFRFPAGLSAVVHVGPVEAGRPCSFSWCRLQMIRADDPDTVHCMNFDAQSADMIPMLHILMDQGSTANASFLDQCLLVHYSYDKVHRLHRDIQGPLRGQLQKMFS